MARPLDKIVKGNRLTRSVLTEETIDIALGQNLDTLCKRAMILDKNSHEYLSAECLLHLIRHSMRQSNQPNSDIANKLLPLLLKRCENSLKRLVSSTIATAEDLREEILLKFAELCVDDLNPKTKNKLDFFEVGFNRAFRFFCIDAMRTEFNRLNRSDNTVLSPENDDYSQDYSADDRRNERSASIISDYDSDDLIFKKQLRAAIDQMPEADRKAAVLHYCQGYKIESNDPNETTVATLCKASGRTIRTRLARAKAHLSKLREDV